MGTLYSEIYDLFTVSIRDHKIDSLYASTPTAFESYLKGFLIKGLYLFDNCNQDLEDRSDATQIFNITLTTQEKVILSNCMLYSWITKEINDVTQISLHLRDKRAFDHYAEQQNLRGKLELASQIKTSLKQDITEYDLKNIDWDAWELGTYD